MDTISRRELVRKYTPVFYFTENERYFPCSWQYLYTNSTPRQTPDGQQYLDISISSLGGELSFTPDGKLSLDHVPVYAYVNETASTIDVTYMVLYTYNGPKNVLFIQEAGAHYGDLEHVTILFDKTTLKPLQMHYAAHQNKDGRLLDWADVEKEGDRPVAYIAESGHGHYHQPGVAFRILGLANDITEKHFRWVPTAEYVPLKGQEGYDEAQAAWIYYPGRFGHMGISSPSTARWFQEGTAVLGTLQPPPFFSTRFYKLFRYSSTILVPAIILLFLLAGLQLLSAKSDGIKVGFVVAYVALVVVGIIEIKSLIDTYGNE